MWLTVMQIYFMTIRKIDFIYDISINFITGFSYQNRTKDLKY